MFLYHPLVNLCMYIRHVALYACTRALLFNMSQEIRLDYVSMVEIACSHAGFAEKDLQHFLFTKRHPSRMWESVLSVPCNFFGCGTLRFNLHRKKTLMINKHLNLLRFKLSFSRYKRWSTTYSFTYKFHSHSSRYRIYQKHISSCELAISYPHR